MTISEAICLLSKAGNRIGFDKHLVLSLTASEFEDTAINNIVAITDCNPAYVEVRALHETLNEVLQRSVK